jgi:hypothetical protein
MVCQFLPCAHPYLLRQDNKAGKDAFADWQNYRENPNVDKDEAFLIE